MNATLPAESVAVPRSTPPALPTARLSSIDAYRGLVMFLMMAEVLRLSGVARATGSAFWGFLGHHQTHAEWTGCSLHDLIQPSFSFLVGVALPFSIASRRGRGQSVLRMTLHACWRAFLLIILGFFLRSIGRPQTYFTFEDTLTQIGLGYVFLFLLGFRPVRDQWIAVAVILVGYWLAFAIYPLPGPDFDYSKVGVSAQWLAEHGFSGFAAHWQKNSNLAWRFDTWFLNLFPREKPFTNNGGGYATLSFIPTLGTMILGLIAGGILKGNRAPLEKIRFFAIAAAACLLGGWLLGVTGICPVVKRIWTPSWTLFSGGWCFLLMAGFYTAVDLVRAGRSIAFPLVVIGMNSIAAYLIAHLFEGFTADALRRHLPAATFTFAGKPYERFLLGLGVLLVFWLILLWMYRRKIFLRI
jgi:heparan-alpha-glucosaminide N-acetyltransferase